MGHSRYEYIACRTDVIIKHTSDMDFIVLDKRVLSTINERMETSSPDFTYAFDAQSKKKKNRYDRKNIIRNARAI